MKNLSKDDKIKYWTNHNLKNFKNKGGIITESELNHIFDWFNSNDAVRHLNNIQKISIPQAIKLSEHWIVKLNKKSSTLEKEDGIKILMIWPDNYKIVRLIDEQSFKREGKLMHNCVSTYFGLHHSVICSLRDPLNNPVATIELQHTNQSIKLLELDSNIIDKLFVEKSFTSLFRIKQIKGNSNKQIPNKYKQYITDFFAQCYDITNTNIDPDTLSFMGLINYNNKNYTETDLLRFTHLNPQLETNLKLVNLNTESITSTFSGKVSIEFCDNISTLNTIVTNSKFFSIDSCQNLKSIKIQSNNTEFILIRNNPSIESLEIIGDVQVLDLTNLPNLKTLKLSQMVCSELRFHYLSSIISFDHASHHKFNLIHISSMNNLKHLTLNIKSDLISIFSCRELLSVSLDSCQEFKIKECEKIQSIPFQNIKNSIHIENVPSISDMVINSNQLSKIKIIQSNISSIELINSKIDHIEINQNIPFTLKGKNSFIHSLYSLSEIISIDPMVSGQFIYTKNSVPNNFKRQKRHISEKEYNRITYIKSLSVVNITMIIMVLSKLFFELLPLKDLSSFISLLINTQKSYIFIHKENGDDIITMIDQPNQIKLKYLNSIIFDVILIIHSVSSNFITITYKLFQFIFASLLVIFFVTITLTIGLTFLPIFYFFYKKGFNWLVEELEDFFSDIFFHQSPFR